MRDLKHLQSNSAKLAQDLKEKVLFRSQRKAVNAGANGTLEYTIKEGVNKSKIADAQLTVSYTHLTLPTNREV